MRAAPTAAWTGPLAPAPHTAPEHKLTWTRIRASPTTPVADAEARVQTVSVVHQRVAVLCPQQDVGPLVCPQSSAWTAVWRGFSPPPPLSTSDKVSVTTTPGSSRVRPPPSWQSSEQAWSGPPEAGRGRKDPWTEEAAGFGLQRVPDTPGQVESPGASCADSKPPLVVPRLLWHFRKPSTMSKGKRQNKDVSVGFSSEVSSFLLSLLTCSFPPCPPEDLETVGLSV